MKYSDEAITHVNEIVRTVEFELASNRTFRLEVLKVEKGTAHVHFAALRANIAETLLVPLITEQGGKEIQHEEHEDILSGPGRRAQ